MDIKEALTFEGLKYFYSKYIKPLKSGAFATVVNNGTTTVANTVLDGRMGKTLADKDANLQSQINTINSTLKTLEPALTSPVTADINYFRVNGGHCAHIGKMYIIHIDVSTVKQIQENYDTGGGMGPRIITELPFIWKYDFNFPAIIDDNVAIMLRAVRGERNIRLNTLNPLLSPETRIIANFSVPYNYVS